MNKKPELRPELRARLNELWRMLMARTITKQELMQHFHTGERQIRDMVSLLAERRPVISTSDKKGYKVAFGSEDLEEAEHTRAELISRSKALQRRIEPLDKFIDEMTGGWIE